MITAGATRDVVLPAGLWLDPRTKRVELGGRTPARLRSPLDTTPMFVRIGAPDWVGLVAALTR
jgi:alpha-glucosidase (family GH31 glycosyl hydrolase)